MWFRCCYISPISSTYSSIDRDEKKGSKMSTFVVFFHPSYQGEKRVIVWKLVLYRWACVCLSSFSHQISFQPLASYVAYILHILPSSINIPLLDAVQRHLYFLFLSPLLNRLWIRCWLHPAQNSRLLLLYLRPNWICFRYLVSCKSSWPVMCFSRKAVNIVAGSTATLVRLFPLVNRLIGLTVCTDNAKTFHTFLSVQQRTFTFANDFFSQHFASQSRYTLSSVISVNCFVFFFLLFAFYALDAVDERDGKMSTRFLSGWDKWFSTLHLNNKKKGPWK